MLTVLLYLQDSIYYDITEYQVLIVYCQVLAEWKQYEVIKSIVHIERVLEQLNIDQITFINELVNTLLNNIYQNEEVTLSAETREHI